MPGQPITQKNIRERMITDKASTVSDPDEAQDESSDNDENKKSQLAEEHKTILKLPKKRAKPAEGEVADASGND